uniref:Uncharacterized protein n=1 Tax=Arundo donax TaxID=35708 RepID=A0A0A8Y6D9_ARUDO
MDAVWSEIPDLSIDTSLVSPNDYFAFPNTYFTMDEFVGAMYPEPQTPTPMEADDPSGGDEDCQAGGKKQKKPPATLGSTA